MSRSRGWCFTINNPTDADKVSVKELGVSGTCKYLICGEEVGEEEKTPHLQGYIHFSNPRLLNGVSKILPRAHLTLAKGTGSQNRAYCVKEEKILVEFGELPKDPKEQGHHGAEYWEMIKQSAIDGSIEDVDPKLYVSLYSQLKAISKDHAKNKDPMDHTTGAWWYGPSGSGKSRAAREAYPDAYIKGVHKWWDGYQGQKVVIIEDLDKFNVAMGGDLKRWCDHYSFPAEIKGSGMNIRPELIIITSQYDIHEIWDDQATVDALERRCKKRKFTVGPFNPQSAAPASDTTYPEAGSVAATRQVVDASEFEDYASYRPM